jgi:hypothetical protein
MPKGCGLVKIASSERVIESMLFITRCGCSIWVGVTGTRRYAVGRTGTRWNAAERVGRTGTRWNAPERAGTQPNAPERAGTQHNAMGRVERAETQPNAPEHSRTRSERYRDGNMFVRVLGQITA